MKVVYFYYMETDVNSIICIKYKLISFKVNTYLKKILQFFTVNDHNN